MAESEERWMPAFGKIAGGKLDGWRYAFVRFEVYDGWMLRVVADCTPPNWPFPRRMELKAADDYDEMHAVPGERAKRLRATPLLAAAFERHGLPPPPWLRGGAHA